MIENPSLTHRGTNPIGEKRYKELIEARRIYLDGAKECCDYTIPCLRSFFEDNSGVNAWHDIKTPFQGIGARGINNLASKLLMALTPTNVPMFRLSAKGNKNFNGYIMQETDRTDIECALAAYTDDVWELIKASGDYSHMYEVWQLLLVSGNVLIFDPDNNSNIRVYSLRDYVLKRDRSGNVMEIVLREVVSPDILGEDILNVINQCQDLPSSEPLPSGKDKSLELYTYAERQGDFYYIHQECHGVIIPGTEGKYPLNGCPLIPIRMYAGAGEDYSRSFVSNYLGDLKSLDALSQGTVEGAAMAAKHIYLIRPDGLTDINDIQNTANGGAVYGRQDDIGVMQSGKAYDLRMVAEEAAKIEKRLSQAFLILDGGIRDADRVTREEIRVIAQELESALGGVYSVMCHAFQMPYIKRKIFKLQKSGYIAPLNSGISPVIITGFEALGMNSDRDRLLEFIEIVKRIVGNDVQQYFNTYPFIKLLAAKMNINISGLIKSEETMAKEAGTAQEFVAKEKFMDKTLPLLLKNAENIVGAVTEVASLTQEDE